MEQLQEILSMIGGRLDEVATGDVVVGSPIKLGSVTLYPVSRISIGLGGGGGSGTEALKGAAPASGTGGGAGGGAKARPVAVLVFSEEGVSVLPISDGKGKLEQIFDKIPELVERLKGEAKKVDSVS
jgi:uncharacterized spore protein YtfJ